MTERDAVVRHLDECFPRLHWSPHGDGYRGDDDVGCSVLARHSGDGVWRVTLTISDRTPGAFVGTTIRAADTVCADRYVHIGRLIEDTVQRLMLSACRLATTPTW